MAIELEAKLIMNDKIKQLVKQAQIKDTLTQEFRLSLDQRIARYLALKPHEIIPNSHFAAVSAECFLLYRDGHYYGTISLSQAVAEALVKFLCHVNNWKPDNEYEGNLRQLEKRGKITTELSKLFKEIWKGRDDYHHLNPKIEQDRQKLEVIAKEKLTNLKNIEKELFAYSINMGKLVPKYPKYWDRKQDTTSVFLRID